MITTYPTCRTAEIRNMRHQTLSAPVAQLRNLGMILRVDIFGSLRLLNNWLINHDVTKPVVDDSPYAGGLGIATATLSFDESQNGEPSSSWSHSFRRKRGIKQP